MPKKVTWKKGMRLSTDIFDAVDIAHQDALRLSALLAAQGNYGLFASPKKFELTANFSNNVMEVTSLSCHGVTKGGQIIDIDFDSHYANNFDTRVPIPLGGSDNGSYLLVVRVHEHEWREVDGTFSEDKYTFELIGENTAIGDNLLPVGCIVNQHGWRLRENDFVPPCMHINAHSLYIKQLEKVIELFKTINECCFSATNCVAQTFLSVVWPMANNAFIRLDKERGSLTPSAMFSTIQQFVAIFVIGCQLDHNINLENKEPFVSYQRKPLDMRHIYNDIEQGLSLCGEISVKVNAVCSIVAPPEPLETPKLKPQPEPSMPSRKRWARIEI